jgi:hypothetical protein
MRLINFRAASPIVLLGLLAAGFAFALVPGCGSNACDDADARYEECGLGSNESTGECTGEAECWASCVADADCDTLTGRKISDDYIDCIADCNE